MKLVWLVLLIVVAGCKKSETPPGQASSGGEPSAQKLPDNGAPVDLKIKWPVGNRYTERMEMTGDTETFMPQSPKPMAQKIGLNQEYSITVLAERPKGGRELELEFESTEIEVTMNGKPVVSLDTRAEAATAESANSIEGSFRQIIGAKIKFLLDESNRVEKVEGVKEFLAKASTGSNPQGRATMQSMFSEDYFKQMIDFQRGLPNKPAKVGDTWPVKTDLNLPVLGVMNMDMNYTLNGWEQRDKRKCAAIAFEGTLSSKAPAAGPSAGMTMSVESGKLKGKSWFDPELGHPVETMINQDMVMHMTIPVARPRTNTTAAAQPATQSITNHTKQKIVIKLADVVSARQ